MCSVVMHTTLPFLFLPLTTCARQMPKPHELVGHDGWVYSLAFSPDSKFLASAGADSTIGLWQVESRKRTGTLKGHKNMVYRIAFSPDGKRLASVGYDGTLRLWDHEKGVAVFQVDTTQGEVYSVAFSPDGNWLATAGDNGAAVWNAATGAKRCDYQRHGFYSVAFSPDGKYVASSGSEIIKVWNAATGKQSSALTAHKGEVYTLAFDRDGTLASCSEDSTICLWDLKQSKLTRKLSGHKRNSRVYTIALGGTYLFSASSDRTAKVWDRNTGKELQTLAQTRGRSMLAVACSADGSRWAASDTEGHIFVGAFSPFVDAAAS